ncbi:hypothetical protein [Fulvivirga sediminis]|uniref:Uncharacterized protein n=1 Tax=Fulvivirga sediminis TaxID=2803949 RepID=A0A937K044_9BACT|nr:hypothetical protein [Fulvivirga sediminis]MBL3657279.1 hypothetical protein [Fulvivirga sediminis]
MKHSLIRVICKSLRISDSDNEGGLQFKKVFNPKYNSNPENHYSDNFGSKSLQFKRVHNNKKIKQSGKS